MDVQRHCTSSSRLVFVAALPTFSELVFVVLTFWCNILLQPCTEQCVRRERFVVEVFFCDSRH